MLRIALIALALLAAPAWGVLPVFPNQAPTVVQHTQGGTIGPTANSVSAVTATITTNALCSGLAPLYLEMGDKTGALMSLSYGTSDGTNSKLPSGQQIGSVTNVSFASATKWLTGSYVLQRRGSTGALTTGNTGDIGFLSFISGYDKMTNDGHACSGSNTPAGCIALNLAYSQQTASSIGFFHYDSAHLENEIVLNFSTLANTTTGQLGGALWQGMGLGNPPIFTSPLMAGGAYGNATEYTNFLRNILTGGLAMHDALSFSPVCTLDGADYSGQTPVPANLNGSHICHAIDSPFPEPLQYSMAHWIESNGDGAFSSCGSYGTCPWIDAAIAYYGIIVRNQPPALVTNGVFIGQQGYATLKCERLARHAWDTGTTQSGTLPSG